MKKMILKYIIMGALISLVVMTIMEFGLELLISKNESDESTQMKLNDAIVRLDESKETINELTENLNNEFISKANAFAWMIKYDPSIIESAEELEKIRAMLDVDELHVTDDKAVIYWGTIPDYFGFDFTTSEQTKPFLPILEDDTLEIAQEAQPNGTEGKLFQYISVPRRDAKGIVQIGMEPVRLTTALAANQPDVILDAITTGNSGSVFAVTKTDGNLVAFCDDALLGTPAADIGLSDEKLQKCIGSSELLSVNGKSYIVLVNETDEYYVGSIIPVTEMLHSAAITTMQVIIMAILAFALLAFLVNHAVEKHII